MDAASPGVRDVNWVAHWPMLVLLVLLLLLLIATMGIIKGMRVVAWYEVNGDTTCRPSAPLVADRRPGTIAATTAASAAASAAASGEEQATVATAAMLYCSSGRRGGGGGGGGW